MKKISQILLLFPVLMATSCISHYIPQKQKVEIITGNDSTKVFIDNDEAGKGKSVEVKARRGGAQILAKTPGFKEQYTVLKSTPYKHPIAFYPLMLLSWPACAVLNMGAEDLYAKEGESYEQSFTLPSAQALKNRESGEKYINLTSIKFEIKDYKEDVSVVEAEYSKSNQFAEFKVSDEKFSEIKNELDKKKEKARRRKKDKRFKLEDNSIKGDDPMYSSKVYETLKETGYIDTINHVFLDENNTLEMQGVINKVRFYVVRVTPNNSFAQCKVDIKWLFRNAYNEVFDSISVSDFSGEFDASYVTQQDIYTMVGDAVQNSYMNLHKNTKFTALLPIDSIFESKENMLVLNKPSSIVTEAAHAANASVIVKRKDKGHGSGFAITNDGYILTNYHVISSKNSTKYEELTVKLNNGIELPARVIRVNKKADIALLKIEYKFDRAFVIPKNKQFTNLQDVYCIGTPKSIELGQSISVGILSNERFVNNTSLLQLNMSVNSGNSGGPIFDKTGLLHGIVKSKLVGENVEGICFAVPAYHLSKYLNIVFK